MLKKTITYTDYNGVERTEDHYFNLTKREITELSLDLPDDVMSDNGGNGDTVAIGKNIAEVLGKKGLYEFVKTIIIKSHGYRTEDGRGFTKSKALEEEFENSIVFDEIFIELVEDEEKFKEFMTGVNPTIFKF